MKVWLSRRIGYYIVLPSQGPAIFWLSLQKIVEATLWAWKGLRKRAWNRREGARAQLLKNDIAQGHRHNINWLKSNGSKMADKSNSTRPWSSICKLNDVPKGTMTVPRHYQKTKEWVIPQLLEWSSHPLAYGITQLTKTNHTFYGRHIYPLWWHTFCGLCVSLNPNKSTSYLSLCLSLIFSRTWASLGPAMWVWVPILGKQFQTQLFEMERWWSAQYFVNSVTDGDRSWRMGEKAVGKVCQGTPFIACQKNC